MKIILATSNPGKLREMQAAVAGLPVQPLDPSAIGQLLSIDEDGKTFAENALKKARAYVDWYGEAAIADDSGLEVDALDGAPGVFSKRWLGPDVPESELVPTLLERMQGVPDEERGAQFRTAAALALPDGRYFIEEGIFRGSITPVPSQRNLSGLPYRQIFYVQEYGKRYADLTLEEDAALMNHRTQAFMKLADTIQNLLAPERSI